VSTGALIGIDVGTTAVKALAVSPSGEVLARAQVGYPLSTPRPGWTEQDPEDWWRATLEALRALAVRPAAIGLSGQMHGLVALDAADQVIRPAILWNDGRTQRQCEAIEQTVGLERLIALTGNRALAGFTAPKLLWLRDCEPDAFAQIRGMLLPKDYVRLRMCGAKATDVSDASGTLLFDVGARAWSAPLMEALELDSAILPPALESPAVTGSYDGAPVVAGGGDQAAGAVGVGVTVPGGPLSVALGTSGVVFAAQQSFRPDAQARVHAFCHAVPGMWHAMGVMLNAGGALRWLRDATGGAPYDELMAEAERWEPGVEGLTFLPYLAGERTPHADPDARGAFAGLSLRHDRGALARAVLEGVAFGLRDSLDLLRELGVEARAARASGGGAASDLFLRVVASALELPVERVAVDEGAAYGAALLAGVGAGTFASVEEAAALAHPTATIEPAWDLSESLERYRTLYPALRAAPSR
jgi:xylulokinase